jgi:hypothetical protein
MPAKTTLFRDPSGIVWRYCTGPCGRALDIENFFRSKRGYHDSWCKECKRVLWRASQKRKYLYDDKFIRRRRRQWRERYWSNAEFRERHIANMKVNYYTRKAS